MNFRLYQKLSAISWLSKSYSLKFLFVAFCGVHVPLVGLLSFFLFNPAILSPFNSVLVVLVFTLVGTGITLWILNDLLSPLRKASDELDAYVRNRQLPELPVHFEDEAGQLLGNLQFTLQKQEMLVKQQESLTALLSHDMRSALNNALGLCEVLGLETDPKEQKTVRTKLELEITRQLKFLGDILQLIKHSELELPYQKMSPVSISSVVEKAIEGVQHARQKKSVHIRFSGNPGLEVKAQPALLKQAIQNILSNAIKFSSPGSSVEVQMEADSRTCTLRVRDFGAGFEPGKAGLLFQRFTSEGRTGTQGEKSIGLGLYLASEILHKHNGSIQASSDGLGRGAVFTIQLPLAPNLRKAMAERQSAAA